MGNHDKLLINIPRLKNCSTRDENLIQLVLERWQARIEIKGTSLLIHDVKSVLTLSEKEENFVHNRAINYTKIFPHI